MAQNIFSAMELDAIGEMMNISLGSSATAVSNLLDHRVDITTPKVTVVPISEFTLGELEPAIGVEIKYVSGLEGSNIMLLKRSDVKAIVELLMGTEIPEEEFELNELTISAVCELMNQMMGAASTALSDFLGRPVNISTPQSFSLDDLEEIKRERFHSETGMLVAVHFILEIEGVLKSEFVNIMSVELARELLAGFGMGIQDTGEAEADATPAAQPAQPEPSSGAGGKLSQEEIERLDGRRCFHTGSRACRGSVFQRKDESGGDRTADGQHVRSPGAGASSPAGPGLSGRLPPAGLSAACVSAPGAGAAGH